MEPISLIAGLVVGGSIGVIVGGLFTRSFWRGQYRYLALYCEDLEAEKERRLAPLKAANAKRHAAKLQREAAERHVRNERLTELRELVGDLA
jgi:hypothetical protein